MVERGDTISWLSSAISARERSWECFWLVRMPKFRMRHQHGPHVWPHLWPWPYSIHGHGAFHSWPWRIPFMAMAHSIHGHGAFHSWPWPYSIYGHGAFPSWPRSCRCRTAPHNCTWENVAIYPESYSPGVTPA